MAMAQNRELPMAAPFRSLKELFLAAVELYPDDRAAWLERECGADAELRQRLGLMLAAHDAPQSLFDQPGHFDSVVRTLDANSICSTTRPIVGEITGTVIGA